MEAIGTLVGALLLAVGPLAAQSLTIELLPAPTGRMELSVEKTGLLAGKKHLFTISRYSGTLRLNKDALEASTVELAFDAASLECRDTWLSAANIRKVQQYALTEMLDAGKFPKVQFRSTGIIGQDPTHYVVQGLLTLRDLTRPVEVHVSVTPEAAEGLKIEGTAQFRLTQFGLKPPTTALGAIGTKDLVSLRFVLPAIPRSTSTAPR